MTASILFLDPPFNLAKDYGVKSPIEQAPQAEYESYMREVIHEGARVLKPGGALFMYHLPFWAARLSAELMNHLTFRHWIAVSMKNGFVRGQNLYPAHYALLYLTKGKPASFARPKLPLIRCRHCGELVRDYGGYRSIMESKGVNLSDIWDDVSPVRHARNKHRSANELPRLVTDRVVEMAGAPDELLIDPFAGSGTSLVSAREGGMRFVGNDLSKRSLNVARRRLSSKTRSRRGASQG